MRSVSNEVGDISAMKIFFFGRKNDKYSSMCLDHLLDLGCEVDSFMSSHRGEHVPSDINFDGFDYIFCFRSYIILPDSILKSPKQYSINFHPGNPKYPGSGGLNLALLNDDAEFGVTVHLMESKVDSGEIVEFRSFAILDHDTLDTLLRRTHNYLYALFVEFTTNIKKLGPGYVQAKLANNEFDWARKRYKIQEIDRLQEVGLDISAEELKSRIRSLHHENFPVELRLHGFRFVHSKCTD